MLETRNTYEGLFIDRFVTVEASSEQEAKKIILQELRRMVSTLSDDDLIEELQLHIYLK
ncbi:hypothetical protein [Paenibacillus pini]|uniref:Uncharacterized protein n=1 Tax=Paenibacillus pini JCM 16418 TaxID=1236976 RepID=W7Z1E5_9BACL|nr:hypothetical protein [Paenibacillus pini]GAF10811.1 hypothetical protein JCM16418_5033 [Paenibacillus pini JCM 16418]